MEKTTKKPKFDIGEFAHTPNPGEDVQEEIVEELEQEDIQRNDDFITIMPKLITPEGCNQIIQQHFNLPFSEVEFIDDNQHVPVDVKEGVSYKYYAENNIDYSTIFDGTKEFKNIIEIFEHIIPNHPDFDTINYMQIAHYHTGSFFSPHKDIADGKDFATMMLFLNDDYKGGRLNVEGNIIDNNQGTVVLFNNSTEMWHSVEPIYEGDRLVLLLWFGRNDELD